MCHYFNEPNCGCLDCLEEREFQERQNEVCACAGCGKMLTRGEDMVQHPVWDYRGDLDYIELAHRSCCPEWRHWDAWEPAQEPSVADEGYWDHQDWLDYCAFQEEQWRAIETELLAEAYAAFEPFEPETEAKDAAIHISALKYRKTVRRYSKPHRKRTKGFRRNLARAERAAGKHQAREILKEARGAGL